MKVTIKFNIGMTFAIIGYALLLFPLLPVQSTPLIVESIFHKNIALGVIVGIFSLAFAVAAFMCIVRALWNRLFPTLCGWKEINLAESYAISIFIGMFLIQ